MKSNQKGFSAVEVLLVVLVVGLIGGAGWLFYDRQKDSQNASQTVEPNQADEVVVATENGSEDIGIYENQSLGFKFSYHTEWLIDGGVEVVSYDHASENGHYYSVSFGENSKIKGALKSKDWTPNTDELYVPKDGFTTYDGCKAGLKTKNIVDLYRTDDTCLVVEGIERTADEAPYEGKSAELKLMKKFSDASPYAGVEFLNSSVHVEDFSEESLKAAYSQERIDGFILIAKSLQEF